MMRIGKSEVPMSLPDFKNECACHALRRVARKITNRYEDIMRPVGLTAGQFTILAALSGMNEVTLTTLADGLGMSRTTLTKDLKPLEARGLTQTHRSPEDARKRFLSLTMSGRKKLEESVPLWQQAQKKTLGSLSKSEWLDLRSQFDGLVDT